MAKDKYMSDLASALQGITLKMSYNDGPEKAKIQEAAHCMDTRNTWIVGRFVHNARGKHRKLTRKERLAWLLFGATPRRV